MQRKNTSDYFVVGQNKGNQGGNLLKMLHNYFVDDTRIFVGLKIMMMRTKEEKKTPTGTKYQMEF